MTYYIGLILKDKTLIAADRRVSTYLNDTKKINDNYGKIAKISQYTCFSGAGNMPAVSEVYHYLRKNNVKFPEDILQIDIIDIRKIYEKWIQRARQEISSFEKDKEIHGYLNLSMIAGGISKEKEPIVYLMNNLNGFTPQLIRGFTNGVAPKMSLEIDQITQDFFKQVTENGIKLNQKIKHIINLLIDLFKCISDKDNSVSPIFDVMTIDINGICTSSRYRVKRRFWGWRY